MALDELNRKAEAFFQIQAQIEALQAEAEAIKDSMKAAMVDRGEEEISGPGWRATWHNTVISKFDSKAFKAAHGDLYTAFCKPTNGTRFTLNPIKA